MCCLAAVFQRWYPTEVMSRQDVHHQKEVSGIHVSFLGMCVLICAGFAWRGRELVKKALRRVYMCESLAERDITRNLKEPSEA